LIGSEELGAPAGRDGCDWEACGHEARRLAGNAHGAPIDLAQKIGNIVGDHIDDVEAQRLGRRQARGAAHGLDGPFRIAAVKVGKAADIGRGIVDGLARLRVRRLCFVLAVVLGSLRARKKRRAAQLNGRCGTEIGAGRHGGDCTCIGDVGAGARGAGAVRGHVSYNRHRRGEDRGIDLAHRAVEPAGRVHAQDHDAGLARRRGLEGAHDVVRDRRPDRAVDVEHDGALCRCAARQRDQHGENNRGKRKYETPMRTFPQS
jgi:hypothetical protein